MRDYEQETANRVRWIRAQLAESGAKGIVYGNSGGKDSALVGALCKKACDHVLGVIMPCDSQRNYESDRDDALSVARRYDIDEAYVDLTAAKTALTGALSGVCGLSPMAGSNINPRLRMTALYAISQTLGYLVAGTGNRSEIYMGYYTKWGDGACDFNPIADLTVSEIYAFLRYLDAPAPILSKAPSAGLYEGQTDEQEMGISYAAIDDFLLNGEAGGEDRDIISKMHNATRHKRALPRFYGAE